MKPRGKKSLSSNAMDYDDSVHVSAVQHKDRSKQSVESMLAQLQLEMTEVKQQLKIRNESQGRRKGNGVTKQPRSKCWICDDEGHLKKSLNDNGSATGAASRPYNHNTKAPQGKTI